MRSVTLRSAVLAGILLAAGTASLSADTYNTTGQALEGSWIVSITVNPDAPASTGLVSYSRDGLALATELVDLRGTPLAALTFTGDHGEWQRTGDREFNVSFIKLGYLPGGVYAAQVKSRASVKLSDNASQFSGRFHLDITDASGNVLLQLNGTITGTRIGVEPPPAF